MSISAVLRFQTWETFQMSLPDRKLHSLSSPERVDWRFYSMKFGDRPFCDSNTFLFKTFDYLLVESLTNLGKWNGNLRIWLFFCRVLFQVFQIIGIPPICKLFAISLFMFAPRETNMTPVNTNVRICKERLNNLFTSSGSAFPQNQGLKTRRCISGALYNGFWSSKVV